MGTLIATGLDWQGFKLWFTCFCKGIYFRKFNKKWKCLHRRRVSFWDYRGANLITIVKSNDGSYKLVITGNQFRKVRKKDRNNHIWNEKYGRRNWKSREATIYIEIDEFVVKNLSSLGDIVQGVINNVYSTAIGNSYTFNISLNNNILFYDATSFEIVSKVEKFLEDLSRGEGVWFIKI